MRKRQKLVLILYAFAVFIIGFLYVPYVRFYSDGIKTSAGHHIRIPLLEHLFNADLWEKTKLGGYTAIDAQLIVAEVIALTAVAIAIYFILQERK